MTSPFDGTGVITAISLAVAFSAYLRTVAMTRLHDFIREEFDRKKARFSGKRHAEFLKKQRRKCRLLRSFAFVQIGLGFVICALTLRLAIPVLRGGSIAAFVKSLLASAGLPGSTVSAQCLTSWIDTVVVIIAFGLGLLYLIVHLMVDSGEIKGVRTEVKKIKAKQIRLKTI